MKIRAPECPAPCPPTAAPVLSGRLAVLLFACLTLVSEAQAEAARAEDVIDGELLPGWQVGSGQQMVGLHLRLAPEWKTYWRAPGDAGIPPSFDWSGSSNLGAVTVHWPQPSVFHTNGMQSVGYEQDVVLPLQVTAIDPDRPIGLRLNLEVGVCKDICIPASLTLSGDFSAGADAAGGSGGKALARALKAVPARGEDAGLGRIACDIEPIADGLRLTARMDLPSRGGEEVVVFESGMADVWVGQSIVDRQGPQLTATTEMVAGSGAPFAIDRSAIRITVLGTGPAAEIVGCPAP